MYLAKFVGGWSTTQIGKFHNGRDHSTVCYALRRIGALREANPDVDGILTALAKRSQNPPADKDRAQHPTHHATQDSGYKSAD